MSDDDKPKLLPSWFETGTVTALLVPLFYTAGWSYAYHYLERFNLGLMGVDIPKEYFFVYSYWAMKERFGYFLLTLAGFVGIMVFGRVGLQWLSGKVGKEFTRRMLCFLPAFVLPVLIFGLFYAFYGFGETAGQNAYQHQLETDFGSYLQVKVWVKGPETAAYGKEIAERWQGGCYRLLMRNKDYLYIFYSEKSEGKELRLFPHMKIPPSCDKHIEYSLIYLEMPTSWPGYFYKEMSLTKFQRRPMSFPPTRWK